MHACKHEYLFHDISRGINIFFMHTCKHEYLFHDISRGINIFLCTHVNMSIYSMNTSTGHVIFCICQSQSHKYFFLKQPRDKTSYKSSSGSVRLLRCLRASVSILSSAPEAWPICFLTTSQRSGVKGKSCPPVKASWPGPQTEGAS
jgi:hypothetical protein